MEPMDNRLNNRLGDRMKDQSNIKAKEKAVEKIKISETIIKYQELFDRDTSSKIFAPLAEAYRKAGELETAFRIASQGIAEHPGFASGMVTLARILIDQDQSQDSISYLKTAIELSPDNFLAHKLLGETYIRLKQLSKALQVFKMALYLDPLDEFAKKMVKKLESLSASDFNEDVLVTYPLEQLSNSSSSSLEKRPPLKSYIANHNLDRYVSLIDAYISRNDFDKASQTLTEAFDRIGKSPELQRRQIFLSKRFADSSQNINEIDTKANQQLKVLNKLLIQIEERRLY